MDSVGVNEMHDIPVAKYKTISDDIAQKIERKSLAPGDRVPSENEIRDTYSVSNTTARKALHELEIRGYVVRVKGRGTFVRQRAVERSANRILSFTKNILQAGRTPSTQVLHVGVVRDTHTVDLEGTNYVLEGPLYKIHRLRFADEVPVLLEVRYVSQKLCPDIDKYDLSGSLYDIYRTAYRLRLSEIRQNLSATLLDESTKEFFNVSETTAGILLTSVTFCAPNTALEMERSIYRGDVYRFSVTAHD